MTDVVTIIAALVDADKGCMADLRTFMRAADELAVASQIGPARTRVVQIQRVRLYQYR